MGVRLDEDDQFNPDWYDDEIPDEMLGNCLIMAHAGDGTVRWVTAAFWLDGKVIWDVPDGWVYALAESYFPCYMVEAGLYNKRMGQLT